MTTLITSLDNLGNLKQLTLWGSIEIRVALCGDALLSLSAPFHNLETLELQHGCTFSRVPWWIGHLCNLRDLSLGVKQVLQEDVAIIGTRLPSLINLRLRIPIIPSESIMIQGSTGFRALKGFQLDCDGMSFLRFEAGAIPELRKLCVILDTVEWDEAAPGGLQYLPSLEEITIIWMSCYNSKWWRRLNDDEKKAKIVVMSKMTSKFKEAAHALPTSPTLIFKSVPGLAYGRYYRPEEA
ncbi:unnamed protein product [Urochloa humidicola]